MKSAEHTAELVARTMPKAGKCGDASTSEQLLAFFARVSNAANQNNHLTGPRLIKRLIADEEWSPLDMIYVNFDIRTSRRIGRQILRHWSMRFQEYSFRWAPIDSQTIPYYTEARLRHEQDRGLTKPFGQDEIAHWNWLQRQVWEHALEEYDEALSRGHHPESACAVLPEGMTPSTLYAVASVRTWLHYCLLRMGERTQLEHRLIAKQVWHELIAEYQTLEGAV